MTDEETFHLFDVFGVELEYMIVDAETLSVKPISDRVLYDVAGAYLSEIELGDIAWSNELALHVIELKTNGPAESLAPLPALFQQHVRRINELLHPMGARLMPTAMHPWMNPHNEMFLWPHEYNPIYESYNRIFDCRGHGWANLQSVHLNLPFADDDEFGRLHAAIRLLLPIVPALAASSPVVERKLTGLHDNRLEAYRTNSHRVSSVTGQVIPEAAYTKSDYQRMLQSMYNDIAPLDPEGILQFEWLNARGAIARFDRNTIEIRLLDMQECPLADVAICAAVAALLDALTNQRWTDTSQQQAMPSDPLVKILLGTIRDADELVIDDPSYLEHFGITAAQIPAGSLWRHLIETTLSSFDDPSSTHWAEPLRVMLDRGPLSRRITRSLGTFDSPEQLAIVYRELCDCLAQGRMFLGVG